MSLLYYNGSRRSPDFSASFSSSPRVLYRRQCEKRRDYLADGEFVFFRASQSLELRLRAVVVPRPGAFSVAQGNFALLHIAFLLGLSRRPAEGVMRRGLGDDRCDGLDCITWPA